MCDLPRRARHPGLSHLAAIDAAQSVRHPGLLRRQPPRGTGVRVARAARSEARHLQAAGDRAGQDPRGGAVRRRSRWQLVSGLDERRPQHSGLARPAAVRRTAAAMTVRTTCPYCGVGCGVLARAVDGRAEVSGDPEHPANRGALCSKGTALGDTVGLQGRLLRPQVRGTDVEWDVALDAVAQGFRDIIEQHGPDSVAFYVSGQLLTEDYYVANKLMKGFIGSANIDTNSRLCMASAVAGHRRAFGADVVPCKYTDLEEADLVVLVGSNLAWCHPILFQRLQAARENRGTKLVVIIDPRRTPTCDMADLHLPLRAGTDVTLFNGLLCWLAQHQLVDRAFVDAHTRGAAQALLVAENTAGDIGAVARSC